MEFLQGGLIGKVKFPGKPRQNIIKYILIAFTSVLIISFHGRDADGRQQNTSLNVQVALVFYCKFHSNVSPKGMADKDNIFVLIVLHNFEETFVVEILYLLLRNLRNIRVLQFFVVQAHSPDLPKHDVAFLKKLVEQGKVHVRRPAESMPQIENPLPFILADEDGFHNFADLADWDLIYMVTFRQPQILKHVGLDVGDIAVLRVELKLLGSFLRFVLLQFYHFMNIFYQLDGLRRMKIWSGKNTKKWSRYYKLFSIIEFLIRLLVQHMHSNNEPKSKCSLQLIELISKIGRLRKRLISCGYSHKQVIDIIFEQFLRLPEIDWSHLQETKTFYELKTKFKAGSNSAEIILRLQKIVPNLHTSEVCQYLLTVLEVNAESFGFNLAQSSSESNDSGSGMQRLAHKRIRRRHKNLQRKEQIINHYRKAENQLQEGSKKVHHDEEYNKKKKAQNDINLYFKNKPVPALLTFEECQLDKEMKKMPESEDSDNI